MGIATVTMVLNESRQQRNLSLVSYHAVQYYKGDPKPARGTIIPPGGVGHISTRIVF